MKIREIEEVKGFMPKHEGEALLNWAKIFSNIGPIFEVIFSNSYIKQESYYSKGYN